MLLIDTLMLVRRNYAKLDFLKNREGQSTGLEFGTLRTLESLQKKYPDQRIVLCLDSPKSWRRVKHPHYKANRKPVSDQNYYTRLESFKKFLRMIYHTSEVYGQEADDVMYTLSREKGSHFIYTNDHDLLQAVSEKYQTVVLKSYKSKLFVWNEDKVTREYGLPPKRLSEYYAFVGDKIDNLIGVLRINRRFLTDLIVWAHSNNLSQRQMLEEIKTAAWPPKLKTAVASFIDAGIWHRNYELMKLKVLPDVRIWKPRHDDAYVVTKLKEWDIYSLELCKEFGLVENEEF